MYTAGSLFSGIGGIDLAFSRAGFDVRWQVEIEPFCRAVLTKHSVQHWPNAVRHEDVRNVGRHNLEAVDVIFGGFPCQDISIAGKGAGIKEGTRSGLWFQFARIISELRPKLVLLENVPVITGRGADIVLGQLSEMGYDAEWGIIPASSVGAPHERERWWCVAYSQNWYYSTNEGQRKDSWESSGSGERSGLQHGFGNGCTELGNSIGERLQGNSAKRVGTQEGRLTEKIGSDNRQFACIQHRIPERDVAESAHRKPYSIMGRAIDGLSRQLDCNRWPARPKHPQHEWESKRTTTKREPTASARLIALGNAVVPQVVQPIAEAIYSILEETNTQDGAA